MLAIYKKEIHSYFTTLIGYVFLLIFMETVGIGFLLNNVLGGNPSYASTLGGTTIAFMFIVPLLTMRLFAEETRQKTDQLLYTSALSISSIVMGKFLAAATLFCIGFVITLIFPLFIFSAGVLEVGLTFSAIVGYIILFSCFIAIGVFVSSITENQLISALVTFLFIAGLFLIDIISTKMPADRISSAIFLGILVIGLAFVLYNSTKNKIAPIVLCLVCFGAIAGLYFINGMIFDNLIYKVLSWLSLNSRFNNFSIGIFDFSDIVYYISFASVFLYLTVNTIEKRRWK